MAFAIANTRVVNLGSINAMVGDWSGAAGDAAGTITFGGGRIYFADFDNQSTTGPQEHPETSTATSGNQITLTIYNHQTVSSGTFIVVYA